MKLFPAIDLYGGKAVRLYQGDYDNMTVYSDDPVGVAKRMEEQGASCLHLVDLEGARNGDTPNLETIRRITEETSLFVEVGGGIRSLAVIERYLQIGVDRVILGTAAVRDEALLTDAVARYGERIAVGVDIRDGYVAIRGWTERSELHFLEFCKKMQRIGVKTLICTDISKDGAMQGANRELYVKLSQELSINIVASGGVSSLEEIKQLADLGLYGAILGKAYYIGAVDLKQAIEVTA